MCLFDGIVRNHSRNRRTLYLEYDCLSRHGAGRNGKVGGRSAWPTFPVRDRRIVHRVGHLEIGETSIIIAVASAHRGAAFDACRWIIDTLKRTVPVWKKEFFEDGATWADGEPFPPDLSVPCESLSALGILSALQATAETSESRPSIFAYNGVRMISRLRSCS